MNKVTAKGCGWKTLCLTALTLIVTAGAAAHDVPPITGDVYEIICGHYIPPTTWWEGPVQHQDDGEIGATLASDSEYVDGSGVLKYHGLLDTERDNRLVQWGTFVSVVDALDAGWAGFVWTEGTAVEPIPDMIGGAIAWGTGELRGLKLTLRGYMLDVSDHPANTCGNPVGWRFKFRIEPDGDPPRLLVD